MSKKVDRKIKVKPRDIPTLDKDEVGDYFNKIWRGVGAPRDKKKYTRKRKHKKDWD